MSAERASRGPLGRVLAVYAICVPLAWALTPGNWPWEAVASASAMALGWSVGLAPWWLVINAVFVPLLAWCLTLEFSPLLPLAGLLALLLVYGSIWASRVPLFFSSTRAQEALGALLPDDRAVAFLDAGCGDARVLAHLAASRPDCRFEGIEHALMPWLLGRLRCWKTDGQYYVRRGNLWAHGLTQYDVVYAYLSPAVMQQFWDKAKREMRPGAVLVSAFPIPGVADGTFIEIDDAVCTRLHVCRIGAQAGAA